MKSFVSACAIAACVSAAAKEFTHTKTIASKSETKWTFSIDTDAADSKVKVTCQTDMTWLAQHGSSVTQKWLSATSPAAATDLLKIALPASGDSSTDVLMGSYACLANWKDTTALCSRTGMWSNTTAQISGSQLHTLQFEQQLVTAADLAAAKTAAAAGVKDNVGKLCGIKAEQPFEQTTTRTITAVAGVTDAQCVTVANADVSFNAEYTKWTSKIVYKYAAATPNQSTVEDLYYGKTLAVGVKYLSDAMVTEDHTIPAKVVPGTTGATGVTTMGSVLAAVSLFALAAW